MAFRNIDNMLTELQKEHYTNPYHERNIHQDVNLTDDCVVALFNLYCTPKKFEVSHKNENPKRKGRY